MLNRRHPAPRPGTQQGVVLIVALVVLVVMALSTAAMLYSMSGSTWTIGNLAFRQSAVASGDQGVEQAIAWLQTASATTLTADVSGKGYHASTSDMTGSAQPAALWSSLASNKVSLSSDAAGNAVAYAIERMCSSTGTATSGTCMANPADTECEGNSQNVNGSSPSCSSQVYYRITVRTEGPRNTVSYTQAMVAL